MGFIPPFYFYTLCDATCGDVVYVRRNAAFTLHLDHVTGDMKRRESNETPHQNNRNYVHELNGLSYFRFTTQEFSMVGGYTEDL